MVWVAVGRQAEGEVEALFKIRQCAHVLGEAGMR